MINISRLPVEIIEQISFDLSYTDKTSLYRTSRLFYTILTPLLSSVIIITGRRSNGFYHKSRCVCDRTRKWSDDINRAEQQLAHSTETCTRSCGCTEFATWSKTYPHLEQHLSDSFDGRLSSRFHGTIPGHTFTTENIAAEYPFLHQVRHATFLDIFLAEHSYSTGTEAGVDHITRFLRQLTALREITFVASFNRSYPHTARLEAQVRRCARRHELWEKSLLAAFGERDLLWNFHLGSGYGECAHMFVALMEAGVRRIGVVTLSIRTSLPAESRVPELLKEAAKRCELDRLRLNFGDATNDVLCAQVFDSVQAMRGLRTFRLSAGRGWWKFIESERLQPLQLRLPTTLRELVIEHSPLRPVSIDFTDTPALKTFLGSAKLAESELALLPVTLKELGLSTVTGPILLGLSRLRQLRVLQLQRMEFSAEDLVALLPSLPLLQTLHLTIARNEVFWRRREKNCGRLSRRLLSAALLGDAPRREVVVCWLLKNRGRSVEADAEFYAQRCWEGPHMNSQPEDKVLYWFGLKGEDRDFHPGRARRWEAWGLTVVVHVSTTVDDGRHALVWTCRRAGPSGEEKVDMGGWGTLKDAGAFQGPIVDRGENSRMAIV